MNIEQGVESRELIERERERKREVKDMNIDIQNNKHVALVNICNHY